MHLTSMVFDIHASIIYGFTLLFASQASSMVKSDKEAYRKRK
jgi:hypothetical protein